jgi:serine protease inhibitor
MRFFPLFAFAFLLSGCDEQATQPDDPTPVRQLTAGERQISRSTSAFGWALFSTVAKAKPDDNIVLSPLSASLALGMTMNGAEGETWSQMRTALRHGTLAQGDINAGYRGLMDVLKSMDPRVTTTIANSVWTRQGFSVLPDFISTLKTSFDAEARNLDFDRADAAGIINDWVKTHTSGKIPSIVDPPISPEMVMYLINAVYFKGQWKHKFDAKNTRDAEFTDIRGAKTTVPMMARRAKVRYAETTQYTAADLPYGWDRYRMAFIVPRNVESLRMLESSLGEAEFTSGILENMVETEAELQIPRFTLEDDHNLNATLEAMGMPRAFQPGVAEFTRINPEGGLYISSVRQKTFIAVDEEGTEAAAATSVGVGTVSMPPTLRADRPFIFVIHEVNTGAILFIGRVASIGN